MLDVVLDVVLDVALDAVLDVKLVHAALSLLGPTYMNRRPLRWEQLFPERFVHAAGRAWGTASHRGPDLGANPFPARGRTDDSGAMG